jgi:hypothetical protein
MHMRSVLKGVVIEDTFSFILSYIVLDFIHLVFWGIFFCLF